MSSSDITSSNLNFTLLSQTSISLLTVELQGDGGCAGKKTMAQIRIALCITELDAGGAERCLTELAVRIDRSRFAPVVYCLAAQPRREDASCLPALVAAGVEVHCLGGRGVWQFPVVAHRLKRLLDAQKPHIIQTFLFHANVLGRIVARRAGVKKVVAGVRVAERGHAGICGWIA